MPILQLPIPETKDSVIRPIVLSAMKDVFKITGIPTDTSILYLDENAEGLQFNSNYDKKSSKTNTYGSNNRVELEVTEEIDNSYVMSTNVWRDENMPVFRDDDLNILIKPVYTSSDIKISVKNRFKDKTEALAWRNSMRMKMSNYQDINTHLFSYHYNIPAEVMYILRELFALRENVAPYNESFEEYFRNPSHGSPRFTYLTNDDGSWKSQPVIAEKQSRIHGWYDFDTIPEEGSKNNDNSAWIINFTYTIRFDRPIGIIFEYPLMVHNQLIDESLRPSYDDDYGPNQPEWTERSFSKSGLLFEFWSAHHEHKTKMKKYGFNIPKFDEFVAESAKPGTAPLCDIMVAIEENDRHSLTNLFELEELVIDEAVMKFIKESEHPFMTRTGKSVFQLSLYNQYGLMHDDFLVFDRDMNIRGSRNLNLRNAYHVRFGIYYDLTYLDQAALDRLRHYPDVLGKILDLLGKNKDKWFDILNKPRVPKPDMDDILDDISALINKDGKFMRTVQTQSIIAMRGTYGSNNK